MVVQQPPPETKGTTLPNTIISDAIAAVVTVSATVAATKWAGQIVQGSDLIALYGLVLGYVFGRNTPPA